MSDIELTNKIQFNTLAELKEWLNEFESTDLSKIKAYTFSYDCLSVHWEKEILPDGNIVYNALFV